MLRRRSRLRRIAQVAFLCRVSRRPRKTLELLGVCPRHFGRNAVTLLERFVDVESIVLVKSLEVSSGFHSGMKRARVMIALMNSGLINVGCPQEGFIVVLENQDGLVETPATLCRMEPVKSCAKNDFVIVT